MKEQNFTILFMLTFFFFLDLLRPLQYTIVTEFLLIGIIFLALTSFLHFGLGMAVVFGYIKDCILGYSIPLNILEFMFLVVLIRYIRTHVKVKFVKPLSLCVALVIHILIHTMYYNSIVPLFWLFFVIHSVALFYIANFFVKKWINILPENST
jgi:hypothetical protein